MRARIESERQALQALSSVNLKDVDRRFKAEDRWRYLRARAHVVLRDRTTVEALYAETFRIPPEKRETPAKPAPGKKGKKGGRRGGRGGRGRRR